MTNMSNTRAKKALEVLTPPHQRAIIPTESAAEASASCGHHPWWPKYPQATATKPVRGINQSRPKIPSTVCPAPSTPENSQDRPAPVLEDPQEFIKKSMCPMPCTNTASVIR